MNTHNKSVLFIGLLSGTSADAIDVGLVEIKENIKLKGTLSYPIPNDIKKEYLELIATDTINIKKLAQLDIRYGILFADAVNELLEKYKLNKKDINAIGSHGQTIWHYPELEHPFSIQIGSPSVIKQLTNIKTVSNFREGDIALGGNGAPLAPAFHDYLYRSKNIDRIILNIGGIANITFLNSNINDPSLGFDTGPGNGLMDTWIKTQLNLNYDKDGNFAKSGNVNYRLLDIFLSDSYFTKLAPKSTGREYFNEHWIKTKLEKVTDIEPADVQATLLELTARTIANEINKLSNNCEVIICGGGVHNQHLVDSLKIKLNYGILINEDFNEKYPADWIEAMLFAWLAYMRVNENKLDYSAVTGCPKPILYGAIY